VTVQTIASLQDYETEMHALGFPEVVVRDYSADEVIPTHTHPFAAKAVVVRGEMWLTRGDDTQHLRVGDGFQLAHQEPHAERYGSEGATYWVGRRAEPWA
jgi:quercetin dioxygenase-like cupin family protein